MTFRSHGKQGVGVKVLLLFQVIPFYVTIFFAYEIVQTQARQKLDLKGHTYETIQKRMFKMLGNQMGSEFECLIFEPLLQFFFHLILIMIQHFCKIGYKTVTQMFRRNFVAVYIVGHFVFRGFWIKNSVNKLLIQNLRNSRISRRN